MKDIPPHLWHDSYVRVGEKKTGGPNLRLLRLDPDQPSNTVTAYIFNKFAHYSEDRYITPREAARLQQFPDSHEFVGPITSVQLQIGNAVPVGLARAVARHVDARMKSNNTCLDRKAVSLFSGAGGMDLGFSDYFNIQSANEIESNFAATLARNFSSTHVLSSDVTDIDGSELSDSEVDLVFGGPPCQPFSAAGKHRGVDDPRGGLVKEYFRIVSELSPSYFVLENVPGLLSNAKGGALKFVLEQAEKIGYASEYFVLNATDFGVPQLRNRLFVIGRRDKSEAPLGRPLATHCLPDRQGNLLLPSCMTVGEAFAGLGKPTVRTLNRHKGVAVVDS
ncbi:DNA (cytosine-5-)-methyltransferase [Brevibacterium linens]|nr:DNA (cytosine-5-)-methyltransferase [Brevibacterium linens]